MYTCNSCEGSQSFASKNLSILKKDLYSELIEADFSVSLK